MSLLRRPPHRVRVQRMETKRTPEGHRKMIEVGKPIPVRGTAEPVRDWSSSEEQQSNGLQILNLIIFRAPTWPGDEHSLIEYEGSVYETVGAPQHHHTGRRTKHWRLTFRWLRTGVFPPDEPAEEDDG